MASQSPNIATLSAPWQRRMRWAVAILLALAAVEFAVFILYRQINLDEGWYILAARLVFEGKLLYRDFAYTQTPLLPYVYGLIFQAIGEGLYQGRVITAALGLFSFGLSAFIARRRGGPGADVFALLLLISSVYAIAQFTYTATYGLSAALMLAALAMVMPTAAGSLPDQRWRILVGLGLMWLAVATRLSILAALLPYAIFLVLASDNRRAAALLVLAVSLVAPLLLLGPFIALAGPQFSYDIFGFHTDRMISAASQLQRMLASTQASLSEFFVLWALALAAWFTWGWQALRQQDGRQRGFELTIGLMAAGLFVAHLAPRTTGSFYHALETPLLAILGGIALTGLARRWWRAGRKPALVVILIGIFLGNLLLQTLALRRYDLFGSFPRNPIQALHEAADFVRSVPEADPDLVTFDTPLAIAAGWDVPPGFEMSIFAYRPNWTTAQAQQFRVINNDLLLDHIRASTNIIAFTDYDLRNLYGDPQALRKTLLEHYRLARTFPGLDPLGDDLHIYLPKGMPPPAPAQALAATLADGISLLGFDLSEPEGKDALRVALTWQARERPSQSYTAFVQLLDAAGNYVSGWDNPPCRGECPTDTWDGGEIIRDEYVLPLPADLPPGVYSVEAGMYLSPDITRLPVLAAAAPVTDNRIRLGEIIIR